MNSNVSNELHLCSECKGKMFFTGQARLSNPPSYRWKCQQCQNQEYRGANQSFGILTRLITLFEVIGQCDTTEGRGGTYVVGHATTKAKAEELAKEKGVFGAPGETKRIECIEFITGEIYALGARVDEQHKLAQLRESARSKLTPEEVAALGLVDK